MRHNWDTIPKELADSFERMVVAPLRVQVRALQRREKAEGFDFAVERARKSGRPGDPHAGTVGMGYWIDDAKREGITNTFELAHSHPMLVELLAELDVYRGAEDE